MAAKIFCCSVLPATQDRLVTVFPITHVDANEFAHPSREWLPSSYLHTNSYTANGPRRGQISIRRFICSAQKCASDKKHRESGRFLF